MYVDKFNYINNFSSFWKGITNPGTNEINSNYGSLVLNEQLDWVIKSLIKDKNAKKPASIDPPFCNSINKSICSCTVKKGLIC